MTSSLLAGIFFPSSLLHSHFYLVLSTIVMLNTTVFAALACAKIIPKWIRPSWFRRGRRRGTTRSIYPDGDL